MAQFLVEKATKRLQYAVKYDVNHTQSATGIKARSKDFVNCVARPGLNAVSEPNTDDGV